MAIAESLLAAVQLARVVNELVSAFQQGKLTEEEFETRWQSLRTRLQSVDDRWNALDERDAGRS